MLNIDAVTLYMSSFGQSNKLTCSQQYAKESQTLIKEFIVICVFIVPIFGHVNDSTYL